MQELKDLQVRLDKFAAKALQLKEDIAQYAPTVESEVDDIITSIGNIKEEVTTVMTAAMDGEPGNTGEFGGIAGNPPEDGEEVETEPQAHG